MDGNGNDGGAEHRRGPLRLIGPAPAAGARPGSDSPYGRSRGLRGASPQGTGSSPGSAAAREWNAVGQDFAVGPSVLALSYVERLNLPGARQEVIRVVQELSQREQQLALYQDRVRSEASEVFAARSGPIAEGNVFRQERDYFQQEQSMLGDSERRMAAVAREEFSAYTETRDVLSLAMSNAKSKIDGAEVRLAEESSQLSVWRTEAMQQQGQVQSALTSGYQAVQLQLRGEAFELGEFRTEALAWQQRMHDESIELRRVCDDLARDQCDTSADLDARREELRADRERSRQEASLLARTLLHERDAAQQDNSALSAKVAEFRDHEDAITIRLREEARELMIARSSEMAHAQALGDLQRMSAELGQARGWTRHFEGAEAAEATTLERARGRVRILEMDGRQATLALQDAVRARDVAVDEVHARDLALQARDVDTSGLGA